MVCGSFQAFLCPTCWERIEYHTAQECLHCRKPSPHGKTCVNCFQNPSIDFLIVGAQYSSRSSIARIIKRMKYTSCSRVISVLPDRIFLPLEQLEELTSYVLTPVPLHINRLRERGFNQSHIIAKHIASLYHIPLKKLLLRRRDTPHQASLSKGERKTNLVGAFEVSPKTTMPPRVIIIDDVATTGNTLIQCAQVLKNKGAQTVGAFVIARGDYSS